MASLVSRKRSSEGMNDVRTRMNIIFDRMDRFWKSKKSWVIHDLDHRTDIEFTQFSLFWKTTWPLYACHYSWPQSIFTKVSIFQALSISMHIVGFCSKFLNFRLEIQHCEGLYSGLIIKKSWLKSSLGLCALKHPVKWPTSSFHLLLSCLLNDLSNLIIIT